VRPNPDDPWVVHPDRLKENVTTNPQESDAPLPTNSGDPGDGIISGNSDAVASPRTDVESPSATSPFDYDGSHDYVPQMTTWLRMFIARGQVVELRALDVVTPYYRRPHVVAGFFDFEHLEEIVQHALKLSENAKGSYFTLNPLNPDLLSRRHNRIGDAQNEMACDKDVLKYRWILLDVDPQRISGVSATNAEKARAWERILDIRRYLHEQRWPDSILADSGNGYHLLYPVDLPARDSDLVKRVLNALGERFDDESVKIDRSVFNLSRITKVYGTKSRKGDDSPERPHRWTSILDVPKQFQAVPQTLLEALVATVSSPPEKTKPSPGAEPVRDRGAVHERARAYLEQMAPAISGDHGHDRTFHAACLLIHGFALSVEEALPIFQIYNLRCQPLWTDEELLHKLQDADKKEGLRGYLLRAMHNVETPGSSGFQANFLDSAALQRSVIPHQWLVKKILVVRQPAVIGGPKKSLKTSLVVDLAISLGSGKPFLNRFQIPHPVKVWVLSGESGEAAILDTAQRICTAKGIELSSCRVLWDFQLPNLSSDLDMAVLTTALIAERIGVVIIDPLYLCLLRGNAGGLQPSNMFDMGPLLLNGARACLNAGTTPVFVHHAHKQNQARRGRSGEPLDLEDLAYSGVAEFARQWLLISRRENFDPELGEHKLWLTVGGSAGHTGLYGLDVREGVMNDSFGGRQWLVTVEVASKAIQASNRVKEERKEQLRAAKKAEERERVLTALRSFTEGKTAPDIAEAVGLSSDKTRGILHGLLHEGLVVRTRVTKGFGSGKKEQPGWMLWRPEGRTFTDEQIQQLRNSVPIEDVLGVPPNEATDNISSTGAEG
jgi:replicative DNA helicase